MSPDPLDLASNCGHCSPHPRASLPLLPTQDWRLKHERVRVCSCFCSSMGQKRTLSSQKAQQEALSRVLLCCFPSFPVRLNTKHNILPVLVSQLRVKFQLFLPATRPQGHWPWSMLHHSGSSRHRHCRSWMGQQFFYVKSSPLALP